MSEPTRPTTNTTLRAILFALLVFFAVDVGVFRSGLYAYVAKPESNAGWFARRTMHADEPVVADGGACVLLLGDSRVGEGIDERVLADRLEAQAVTAVQGGIPGSTPRTWTTAFACERSPHRGFDLVVVGLAAFDDDAEGEDFRARELDLAFLGPWLGPTLAAELAADLAGEAHPDAARDVWLATFVKSFAWRRDVQDFAAEPWTRYREVRRQYGLRRWGKPYEGVDRTVAAADLHEPSRGVDNAAYRRRWLGQLVRDVRATGADVLFVRMPEPFAPRPRTGPRVLDELARTEGVHLAADDAFGELHAPQFCFDALHLNRQGRARFTELLAPLVEATLRERARRAK